MDTFRKKVRHPWLALGLVFGAAAVVDLYGVVEGVLTLVAACCVIFLYMVISNR